MKLAGKGADGARAHLRYLQRDGVTREGEPGALYDADSDRVDTKLVRHRHGDASGVRGAAWLWPEAREG